MLEANGPKACCAEIQYLLHLGLQKNVTPVSSSALSEQIEISRREVATELPVSTLNLTNGSLLAIIT